MSKHAVIYEPAGTGHSAYAPDLPGCIATGGTLEETRTRMHDAIEIHVASMREDGDLIPKPSYAVDMLDIA
jgi:predicted RNase H-like HicB family nuclease